MEETGRAGPSQHVKTQNLKTHLFRAQKSQRIVTFDFFLHCTNILTYLLTYNVWDGLTLMAGNTGKM